MSIHLKSYAKINWTLDVLFKRKDGYHEVRTIYQSVSLYDRLYIEETSGKIEVTCDDSQVPSGETNLAYKAAQLLQELAGVTRGARVEIEKRILVAAGLGGGSSNAASVLRGLALLWDTRIPERDLIEIAMELGSDVPYFLVGGTAVGVGRGEEVYPIEEVRCDSIVLANPGFEVSTAAAYDMLNRLTRQEADRIIPLTLLAAKGIRRLPLAAGNDLEQVVEAVHPEIAEVKSKLLSLGAKRALMSGSGGTVLGVFDNLTAADRARDQLRTAGLWAEVVRTVDRQEYQATQVESER